MTSLRDLREYDARRQAAIAAGGGPKSLGDHFHVYCPECDCNKSGNVQEANPITEACQNAACRCHDEEQGEYVLIVEVTDGENYTEVSMPGATVASLIAAYQSVARRDWWPDAGRIHAAGVYRCDGGQRVLEADLT